MKKIVFSAVLTATILTTVQPAQATCGALTGFIPGSDIGFLATGPISLAARAAACTIPTAIPVAPSAPAMSGVAPSVPAMSGVAPSAPIVGMPAPVPIQAPINGVPDSVLGIGTASAIQGLAIGAAAFILYQVVTGENRPPTGNNTLLKEACFKPSGKAYRLADWQCIEDLLAVRPPVVDVAPNAPLTFTAPLGQIKTAPLKAKKATPAKKRLIRGRW